MGFHDLTKPDEEDVLPLPDKPGTWFYQATRMPTTVIRKEDGELYFKGGCEGQEEMKVADFGKLKAADEHLSKYGFVRINPILEMEISAVN